MLGEVLAQAQDTAPVLEINDLNLSFSAVKAVQGVSLTVHSGEIFAIIGPNGAGKTSILNCISGLYKPDTGTITFDGQSIIGRNPHSIANLGVARTFQNIELFPQMTVLDNLMLGRHRHLKYGTAAAMIRFWRASKEEAKGREVVEAVIEFLGLEAHRKSYVLMLPYGVQKQIELGRALVAEPKVLLLDEPAAGMNLEETEDMARFITDIRRELGIGVVLIDHDMRMVMDLADTVLAIDFGRPITTGTPSEVQSNKDVIRAYLGEEHSTAKSGEAT